MPSIFGFLKKAPTFVQWPITGELMAFRVKEFSQRAEMRGTRKLDMSPKVVDVGACTGLSFAWIQRVLLNTINESASNRIDAINRKESWISHNYVSQMFNFRDGADHALRQNPSPSNNGITEYRPIVGHKLPVIPQRTLIVKTDTNADRIRNICLHVLRRNISAVVDTVKQSDLEKAIAFLDTGIDLAYVVYLNIGGFPTSHACAAFQQTNELNFFDPIFGEFVIRNVQRKAFLQALWQQYTDFVLSTGKHSPIHIKTLELHRVASGFSTAAVSQSTRVYK